MRIAAAVLFKVDKPVETVELEPDGPLSLHDDARAAGVPMYIGCGSPPAPA
ncbi:hypothetical protein ACFXPS_22615 [Nocardia sp. NPDC059091]|uniref:hypothetical protein n=1 Tax=unclassified Nocardia TaxID=2637762 RepID=UPI00368F3CC9